LQIELNKVKKENFGKKEKISNLEKELKENEKKLNQANEKINKSLSEKSEI
jgi:hypothetical protein